MGSNPAGAKHFDRSRKTMIQVKCKGKKIGHVQSCGKQVTGSMNSIQKGFGDPNPKKENSPYIV